jgi:hypothetical protein
MCVFCHFSYIVFVISLPHVARITRRFIFIFVPSSRYPRFQMASARLTSSSEPSLCFSPWELASLKVVYHRFDDRHKGFLDADDLHRVCTACHLLLTPAEFQALVLVMDANQDGRFSFEEFVTFLALSGPENPGAVQMRERIMRADAASLTAGAALGIIPFVKGKLFVVLGTLFYDPIRLFRDSFVDYSATLRHRLHMRKQRRGGGSAAVGHDHPHQHHRPQSLISVLKAHASGSHVGKTAFWLTYTISLDCIVGAAMFLSYSRARRWCVEKSEATQHRNRLQRENALQLLRTEVLPPELECSTVTDLLRHELGTEAHRQQWRDHPILSCYRVVEIIPGLAMSGHPLRLEAVAGGVGGAVSGFLQGPCHYLATFGNAHIGNSIHHTSVDDAAATMATQSAMAREARKGRQWVYHRTSHVANQLHRGCFLALRGTTGAVCRNAAGHAAFFAAFSGARAVLLRSCFGPDAWLCTFHRTTLHDTWVTAVAGCAAGAAYRTVSVPITNLQRGYYTYLAVHSPVSVHANLFRQTQVKPWLCHSLEAHYKTTPSSGWCVTACRRFLFRGFGESLMYTMPVTGVAFLAYEHVLLRS